MSRRKVRSERTHKRIRGIVGGVVVVDSTAVELVWENDHYPQYYVPQADIAARLEPTVEFEPRGGFGTALRHDLINANGNRREGAAWTYPDVDELAGLVRFEWDSFESWFEEDETVTVHPRSPYVRVDCLRSSRNVRVEVGGTTIAHSDRTVVLFETGLSARFYLPPTDVRLDVFRESDTRTSCPYKGHANYLHVELQERRHPDLAWYYPTPLAEALAIAGMIAFHDDRSAVYVDGVRVGVHGV